MAETNIDQRADYNYQSIDKIDEGINREVRHDLLQPQFLYDAFNVRSEKDSVILDTGYAIIGQTPLLGVPQREPKFHAKDGTVITLCITTKTVYIWDHSVQEWQYLDDGTATTTDATAAGGATSISVVDETGFSAGDDIGIDLASGAQHQTTVASTSAGSITLDDAIPADDSVNSSAAVKKAATLTSNTGERVDVAPWPAADFLFVTNNVDNPFYYDHDNGDIREVQNLPSDPFRAVCVDVFFNYVMFFNVFESGDRYPQRIRRSDTGDPTEWAAGNAGFEDLWDTEGVIKDTERLGDVMFVYKDDAYIKMEHVGTTDRVFNTETTVFGKGVLSVDCAITVDDVHLLFDRHEISVYDGGAASRPLSLPIEELFAGVDGNFANNKAHLAFGIYLEERREVMFFYPSNDALNGCDKVLRLNVVDRSWFRRDLTHEVISFGRHKRLEGVRWDELEGTWEEQLWRWDSQAIRGNVFGLLLGARNTNEVYFYDFLQSRDKDTILSYIVETGDFDLHKGEIRTDALRAMLKGQSIKIYLSLDRGQTWELLDTVNPGGEWTKVRVDHQRVGWTIRYKFTGSGTDFGVRWVALKMREETEY